MAFKARSESFSRYDGELTIAERDKIDQIMHGMSKDYQIRAVQSIKTDLLLKELERRNHVKYQIIENIFKLCTNYYTDEKFNLEKSEEFISSLKEALIGISRC